MRRAFVCALLPCAALANTRVDYLDPESGTRLYVGAMTEVIEGDKVTLSHRVCRLDGSLVAEQRATLDKATRRLGEAVTRDLRIGKEERLAIDEDRVSMTYRERTGEALEKTSRARTARTVVPQALGDAVRGSWKKLLAGEPITVELAIPEAGRLVGFRLTKTRVSSDRLTVSMEPTSWLVRRFVSPMEFDYGLAEPHLLLEYRGETFVADDEGERRAFRVVYTPDSSKAPRCR